MMSRSKKIFIGFAIVFFMLLLYVSYDISTRTTFPGSKPQLKERIKDDYSPPDSLSTDSARNDASFKEGMSLPSGRTGVVYTQF
jgi:hypothetical protein